MSYWYPRAVVQLRILPEDFHLISDASLQNTYRINVMAKDITITKNDYKTTDTFSMDIDFKNFPFDPRTIRSCGVVIYLQDIESLRNEDGSEKKLTPGGVSEASKDTVNFQGTNAVFAGFVDEDQVTLDESNRTVHFEGRDYTALLIDQKYQMNAPIALTQPIDVILTTLLANFKATQQIKVVNKTGGTLPTLAQYYPGFGNSSLGGQRNTGSHESYWEIIQDLVSRAGLICYMNIDKLILTTPRNQIVSTADDIKFIYGKNVKNLTYKRKLGRFKGFGIEVRSRSGKEVVIARIPEDATAEWANAFGIERKQVMIPVLKPDGSIDSENTKKAPYIVFPVPNIGDKDQLVKIGQTTYEQYSLQQLEGSFETLEMLGRGQTYDSNGHPKSTKTQYDLTQIQKGQSVCIEIDADDLAEISRLSSTSERANYLEHRSYDKTVAAIFAKTMGKFSPRFFIKSYVMHLGTSGFSLKVNFVNVVDLTHRGLS